MNGQTTIFLILGFMVGFNTGNLLVSTKAVSAEIYDKAIVFCQADGGIEKVAGPRAFRDPIAYCKGGTEITILREDAR